MSSDSGLPVGSAAPFDASVAAVTLVVPPAPGAGSATSSPAAAGDRAAGPAWFLSRVLAVAIENWGTSGPPANAAASSLDMGRAKKNPCAASAVNERTMSTWEAVSTLSTMADIPSEWAMWMTVSTTRRLIPSDCSSPLMNEPSILSVLMEWRLRGSNEDQLVPTLSTDSWTPICESVLRSAEESGSTMASSVTSRVS